MGLGSLHGGDLGHDDKRLVKVEKGDEGPVPGDATALCITVHHGTILLASAASHSSANTGVTDSSQHLCFPDGLKH